MKLSDLFGKLNRLQRTTRFKIIASVVVIAVGATLIVSYVVGREAARTIQQDTAASRPISDAPDAPAPAPTVDPGAPASPPASDSPSGATPPEATATSDDQVDQAVAAGLQETQRVIDRVIADVNSRRTDTTALSVGIAVGTLMVLAVIWIGQGLTALGIGIVLAGVCWPLASSSRPAVRSTGQFSAGIFLLVFSFTTLTECLRLALSGRGPVSGIARNVVNEAVRMKVSLVFIVLLIFALASLPGLLHEETPLRYRVQSFLQYGTGGSFWIIATLVLFLGVGTVAFEQRDRVIWQTMTKPVPTWKYLLGKWVGVCGVAAVLLAVCGSGVFLFTEYLRNQKAVGEVRAFVPADSSASITEDRFVLETQVLSARRSSKPVWPILSDEALDKEIKGRLEKEMEINPRFDPSRGDVEDLKKQIIDAWTESVRTVPGAENGTPKAQFVFYGLDGVRDRGGEITIRYKVDVGSNDPRETHKLSFLFENYPAPNKLLPEVRDVALGQPLILPMPSNVVRADGTLVFEVWNGDLVTGRMNAKAMSFPVDGLEVFYSVGSYRLTFFRVMCVLWMKLAFLAMVAIVAATFLSFSVASLVAFGTFLIAESAAFLWKSLDYYDAVDAEEKIIFYRLLVRAVALPISWFFRFYADLRPTANLVEGRLVGWNQVGGALLLITALTAALYLAGVVIFRRRELATYSGQ